MTTERQADARPELEEFQKQVSFIQSETDIPRPRRRGRGRAGQRLLEINPPKNFVAPKLTAVEQARAAETLRGALDAGQIRYPELANTLLNDPSKLWLMSEVQMMLSPEPNEVSYDLTADLMEGLTTTSAQRKEYEFVTAHQETQQLFWNEIGTNFEQDDRQFLIDTLAQLSPRGADRVSSLALAWVDTHGLETDEDKQDLFLNMLNWSQKQDESDRGNEGIFGTLDFLQEQVEQRVVSPLINAGVGLLSGAEEAARRRNLTVGQQIAYQFGIEPPRNAGDFGWWEVVSGGSDALVEVGADPLAWLAGVGAGIKAARTIPIAINATKSGRALAAARSILPKQFTGASKVSGGRFARITYSLTAKSVDDLLEQTVKNGVAKDAMNLIKGNNLPRFERQYSAWRNLSDEAIRTIQEAVETPEEFVEVLKADALNEVLRSGDKLDELTKAAHQSEKFMREAVGEMGPTISAAEEQLALRALSNWQWSSDQLRPTIRGLIDGVDISKLDKDSVPKAEALIKVWKKQAETPGGLVRALNKEEIADIKKLKKGDMFEIPMASSDVGGKFADQAKGERWRAVFDDTTRAMWNDKNQMEAARGGDEWLVSGRFVIESIDEQARTVKLNWVDDILPGGGKANSQSFGDLLLNQTIPREARLKAAKDHLRLKAFNSEGHRIFVLSEVPQKPKRIFSWQKVLDKTEGQGRLARGVRRTTARVTPGRIPDEIEIFNTRQGADDLRRLGEHFGLEQNSIDELVGEFVSLERGARQDWVWDTFMRKLGRETQVPAFEHQLVQFYKGSGIRNFSSAGVDLLDDGSRIPLLSSQMTAKMPVPTEILTQIHRRAQSIGNRGVIAKAFRMTGRGAVPATRKRRKDLVKTLRRELGEQAEDLTDDQLYEMAFSLVSPNSGLDGRGIWAGKMMPKLGSGFNQLHSWFTKSMLVFRPIQWMWRVAILEEPIRAHLFNLPSIYQNPLQYMARARQAHYVANVRKWADANMSFAQDVMTSVLRGSKDDILKRLDEQGLKSVIFGGAVPDDIRDVRRGVEKFIENALYGRIRPNRLDPIKKVPWAVKNRAHSIKTAEKAMDKLGIPKSFDFHQETKEISQQLVSGYLGQSLGTTHRKLYQWQPGLTRDEAFTHGEVWGAKLGEFVDDPLARMSLQRYADILRGRTPSVDAHDVINSSRWELMAPDLRLKYASATDDLAVAEKYMDDMLSREIDHLFKPFADEVDADMLGDMLEEFALTRQLVGSIGNELIEWDLRSANRGAGVRQVGDFVASVRRNTNIAIPNNLPAPSFDPRFMAEDVKGWPSQMAHLVLQTFGEKATQTLNRRPAWVHEYSRWYNQYTKLDVPAEVAETLATEHANKMVNYVFFNMNEAPYYVARLNKILPFFGATYEVLGAWSYKMPVSVGGTWPAGVGEFARKFDRLIDAFVNMGVLDREENQDGTTNLTLNLVPTDASKADSKELGRWLQGAGFKAVNTLDQSISTILNMEEGLGLRSQGYRLAAGHPLNPSDYGILSFAQTDVGFNPATNIAVTALAALIPGAGAPRNEATKSGETLAEVADRLNVDVNDLVRYNREVFVDTEDFGSTPLYEGILSGDVDPSTVTIPDLTVLNLPQSSLYDALSDTFMPFGEIQSLWDLPANFMPSSFRWVAAGFALQNEPDDEFWKDSDFSSVFGGLLPEINEAQMASQLNEAFMYLEAHDLVNGKGPFERIQEKEARIQEMLGRDPNADVNELRKEIDLDIDAFLNRVQKVAAESLILRGLTGQFLPTTPGHVRREEEMIRNFWDTKDYADSLRTGEGKMRLKNFKSMEEVDQYKEQLAAWLDDPTSDRARAAFRKHNPQLMAYLTPKTFYTAPVPDIQSYEEYQRQIEAGEREPSPLHVTMWRARSASIQADYYNKYISEFGGDPLTAAADALQNRSRYDELREERNQAYQALEMWDDMHGGVYDNWRTENYDDVETWAQDQINDRLNTVRDNMNILFELEDYLDVELDLEGIAGLNSGIRGAISEISQAIRSYNELTDEVQQRNPYEEAINRYFEDVYIPYAQQISDLYDQLPEVADDERQSLIYERIKFVKNQYADTLVYLDGNTTVPFPNPLEYSWQGKSEEERQIKRQQWVTRPVEWMDLDQAKRILEVAPELEPYVPSSRGDFDVYRQFTMTKLQIEEMFENNEITRSERRKAVDNLEADLRQYLVNAGRGKEVVMMDLTPYEKLEVSGLLPDTLANFRVGDGILGDVVRYYKEVLEANEESAGTIVGRQVTQPLYDLVTHAYFTNPDMRDTLQDLGTNLKDSTLDLGAFLPWLFFDYGLGG